MLQSSNYHISVYPTSTCPKWQVNARISPEFRDFARKQKIDHNKYEKLGLEAIHANWLWFKKKDIKNFLYEKICGWDNGLLIKIQVPGNAATLGLAFYWEHKDKKDPLYSSDNFDNSAQVTAALSVFTRYLNEIDYKIDSLKRYNKSNALK